MTDYEQRYKEALEGLKEAFAPANGCMISGISRSRIEQIFPELRESEDERMREFISHELACLREDDEMGSDRYGELTDAIAWLGRKGERSDVWHAEDERNLKSALGYIEDEYLRRWFKDIVFAKFEDQGGRKETNLVEILKHYPRETELYSPLYGKLWLAEVNEKNKVITCYKHRLEEGCTRAVLDQEDTVSFYSNGTTGLPDFNLSKDCMLFLYDFESQDWRNPARFDGNARRMFIKALERVEEQSGKGCKLTDRDKDCWWEDFKACCGFSETKEPADSAEPRFHKSDWVVCEVTGLPYQIKDCIFNSTINKYGYDLTNGDYIGSGEADRYRLWTIKDARDGDVLSFDDNIVIFKDLYDATTFHSYCHIEDDEFGISEGGMPDWWNGKGFHPATGEQRELLFQKMKEAGYEWDSEKKELMKIGRNQYPELDEAIELYYFSYGNGKGGFDDLSLEKFRDIVKTFVEDYGNNPALSKKDENALSIEGVVRDDRFIDFDNSVTSFTIPMETGLKNGDRVFVKIIKKESVLSINKVEPRFKVGDWVVHGMPDGRKAIRQIVNMTNKSYVLDGEGFNTFYFNDLENDYHLWTIQDAMDGDVIVAPNGTVFLFKDIKNNKPYAYCGIDCTSRFRNTVLEGGKDGRNWTSSLQGICPATRVQRDFLFQKMKEAGYEWDSEKKELMEIDRKPAWSEEDEQNLNGIVATMEEDAQLPSDTVKRLCGWLKSIKERMKGE